MRKKVKDYHVTILEDTHNKLKELAEIQRRSMRSVITILIEDALKKGKK